MTVRRIACSVNATPSTGFWKGSLTDYVELHAASAFSFLRGASLPETLVERAAALGYSALALLDADGVYGAPRFHKAATQAGLRPIIGAELTMAAPGAGAGTGAGTGAEGSGQRGGGRAVSGTRKRGSRSVASGLEPDTALS